MWAKVAAYWSFPVLAAVLLVAAVMDVRTGKIRNVVTYPAVIIGLIGHTLVGGLGFVGPDGQMGLLSSLLGLALGSTLLLAWLAGGIGGGDAKLMIAVGALRGWQFALTAMFWGFLVAALMAVVVMLRRRIVRRTLGRIVRFLVLVFTPGRPASPAAEDSPKIAFGLALCIGSAIAMLLALIRHPLAERLALGM